MAYSLIPTLVVNLVFKTFCSVYSEVISFGKFFSVFRIMEDFINKYSHSKSFNLVKLACGIKSTVSAVEFLQILLILPTYGFCVTCESPTSKKVHFRQPGNFAFFRCLTCKKRISIRTFFQKGKISFRRFILLCQSRGNTTCEQINSTCRTNPPFVHKSQEVHCGTKGKNCQIV